MRIIIENLLSFFIEVFLFEFFCVFENLCIVWYFELLSEIKDDRLHQVIAVVVEVLDHFRLVSRVWLFLVCIARWCWQISSSKVANVCPEIDERHMDLFKVGKLLFAGCNVCTSHQRNLIIIDLKLKLLLNMYPDKLEQVLRISVFIKETKLTEIHILKQWLASMNLRLIILAIHENRQETLCCLKTEDWCDIWLLICNVAILLMNVNLVDLVECINDFRVGDA